MKFINRKSSVWKKFDTRILSDLISTLFFSIQTLILHKFTNTHRNTYMYEQISLTFNLTIKKLTPNCYLIEK